MTVFENDLGRLLAACQELVGCADAGITACAADGDPYPLAVTSRRVEQVVLAQSQIADGPLSSNGCAGPGELAITDLDHDLNWPAWSEVVAGVGFSGVLVIQLTALPAQATVLVLYFDEPISLDDDQRATLSFLMAQATMLLTHAETVAQLCEAIDGRTRIGQAQGLLMERFGLTPDAAFAVLRRHSQDSNTKLRTVAQHLVDTGVLGGEPALAATHRSWEDVSGHGEPPGQPLASVQRTPERE